MGWVSEFLIFYNPWVLFVWGACWGSFFNVVLYRYPLGLSVVAPASACPSCKRPIAIYDNIPVFSWLLLAGKCRRCRAPYSPMYAINEAGFGLLSAIAVFLHPQDWLKGLSLGMCLITSVPMVWLLIRIRKAPWYLVGSVLVCGTVYLSQFLG